MREKKDIRLSRILTKWYNENKRDLPWRDVYDPYIIWISEIILQQTRVDQGTACFMRFVEKFPNVEMLACAKEDEVLKLWQGLGYYSRARNLHVAAKEIMNKYNGVFPRKHREVLDMKGVGEYTAAAIMSFAYNEPYAAVDGNVYRVLSRIFAEKQPIDTSKGKKLFAELASLQLDEENPGIHNQAMMEFGALLCVPVSPNCVQCPAEELCLAYARNEVELYPVKEKKQKIRVRHFHYFNIHYGNFIYLQKREEKDIWRNLYEFPLVETEEEASLEMLYSDANFKKMFREGATIRFRYADKKKHILSHQTIYATFYEVEVDESLQMGGLEKVRWENVGDYPVSRLIHKYLETL